MASEQERLSHLIDGLNNEIDAIKAQIPMQQDRIQIAEALVNSISQLVAKGVATDVEYKRRQSETLNQRQNLSVLMQQLAARQINSPTRNTLWNNCRSRQVKKFSC